MVPRAGIEPARPFSGKRRILSPQCLPISPSGPALLDDKRCRLTRTARACNARYLSQFAACANYQYSNKKGKPKLPFRNGAGKEARTLDLNLGKVALYQLSYSRICFVTALFYQSCIVASFRLYCIFWLPQEVSEKKHNLIFNFGGATRSRTGLTGFAIRGITALLSRQT